MKNAIRIKVLFCIILFICLLYLCISLESLEQNYSEHGMLDAFQPTIGNIDMSEYMPKQTVNIKYDLNVRYSLTDLYWYGIHKTKFRSKKT